MTTTQKPEITGKSFIGLCPPCSSSGSARCGAGASRWSPTATHGHVSSDSWRPWVSCGSGKRRVGAKGGIRGWMGPPALLHPLGAASGCKPRGGGHGAGRGDEPHPGVPSFA